MTYYLLPKTNHFISIKMNIENEPLTIYTSHSLFYFYHKISEQFIRLFLKQEKREIEKEKENEKENEKEKIENISKIFHPYEYIFKKMPNSKFSVSKLKNQEENFYDFYEIVKTVYLFEDFYKKNMIILNIGPNSESINHCIELSRNNSNDEIITYPSFHFNSFIKEKEIESAQIQNNKKYDFIFYELEKENYYNTNEYIAGLIKMVIVLLKTQKQNGCCVIKIKDVFFKPVLDIIYLLTSFYEKTYIIKPMANDSTTFYKYIVCKNYVEDSLFFSFDHQRQQYCEKLVYYLNKFQEYQEKNKDLPIYISSILDFELPCYFISKINDINIIIGQQQLDTLNQIILFLKNKNKEKMNQMIKTHIYKSVKWCEKFKIPYNTAVSPS